MSKFNTQEQRPEILRQPFPKREGQFIEENLPKCLSETCKIKYKSQITFCNEGGDREKTFRDTMTFKKPKIDEILPK
ncbi:hypothetical protein SS50377_22366 [Spironucleus salmonicida]|uniref:Uncharacterized protein n=1 Tax=Spironucleus salmonicida TaxID=348837 RepID=V6LN43_9EUKA|nr:hypothetical protein SS50377_22366 [Spironucleus salmonicida]|eukprot:EST42139.1 Hypothetical protein SS50377_18447 [Spironucleus salmonicida]